MLRVLVLAALCLLGGAASATEKMYNRGEFRFAIAQAPDFIVPNKIAEQWPGDAPGAKDARWRNWLLDSQSDYRKGGSVVYYDQAIEAVSSELVKDAAKHQIYFSPDYQNLVLHAVELRRAGVWTNRLDPEKITLARREAEFESDMSDGMVSALIVLDDVRVGDVIRMRYTIDGMNPILKGMDHDEIYFAWIDPILHRSFRALYDPGTNISRRSFNGAPEAVIEKQADAVVVSAKAHQVAGQRDEGAYPRWYRPFPSVMFAPQRTWADVVSWAKPLYPNPEVLPKELEAKMQTWKAIADPEQRLMAVLQSMQEDIRYFGIEMGENSHRPHSPTETWERRFGDCKDKAYLTSVVLTRLGIPSVPALAATKMGKGVRHTLPAATAFNHVIVQAQLGKQTVWIDPTMTQQRGNATAIDVSAYGYVLPIADGVTDLREVERKQNSKMQLNVQEKYRPSADGKTMDLLITSEFVGSSADDVRRNIVARGREEMGRGYAEYYRKRFGELEITAPFSVADDQAKNTLIITESYRLKQPWDEKSGSTKNISVYADSMDQDTKLPETIDRQSPLYLNFPMQYQHEQILELPQGWTWQSSGETASIKTTGFDYQRVMEQRGQMVAIKHNIRFNEDHVPTEKLSDHFSKMREVRDGMNRRFVLAMPAASQEKDREARLKNILRDAMDKK